MQSSLKTLDFKKELIKNKSSLNDFKQVLWAKFYNKYIFNKKNNIL